MVWYAKKHSFPALTIQLPSFVMVLCRKKTRSDAHMQSACSFKCPPNAARKWIVLLLPLHSLCRGGGRGPREHVGGGVGDEGCGCGDVAG